MTPEKQDDLFDRYPELFSNARNQESREPIAWGITCGDGWFSLIDSLCAYLMKLQEREKNEKPIRVVQIKEKFGTLRFYVMGVPAREDKLNPYYSVIHFAEQLSATICEECGNAGALREGGWWRTLCDPCEMARGAR